MRLGQTFQHVVVLDAANKAHALVVDGIQHLALDQPGIDPRVQVARQRPGLADRLPHEPHRAFSAAAVAPPQDRMHEALAQTSGLVTALGAEAGDDGIVHLAMVVAVPGPAGLFAVNLDRQRVNVQCAVRDLSPAAGGLLVARHPRGEGLVDRATLGLARQAIHQPPVRWLAGQSLVEHPFTWTVPYGQLHRRVVGQHVLVVLVGVAQGQTVEVLAEQLDLLISASERTSGVVQAGGQVRRQPQAVVDLAGARPRRRT